MLCSIQILTTLPVTVLWVRVELFIRAVVFQHLVFRPILSRGASRSRGSDSLGLLSNDFEPDAVLSSIHETESRAPTVHDFGIGDSEPNWKQTPRYDWRSARHWWRFMTMWVVSGKLSPPVLCLFLLQSPPLCSHELFQHTVLRMHSVLPLRSGCASCICLLALLAA